MPTYEKIIADLQQCGAISPPGTMPADPAAEARILYEVAECVGRRRGLRALMTRLKSAPPSPPAPPHTVLHEGRLVMSVPLQGENARGRRFLVDLLAWERVSLLLGSEWTVREDRYGGPYVVSYRKAARRMIGDRTGSAPRVVLARWLLNAGPDDVVTYAGDTLDLTKPNLRLQARGEFWDQHRVVPMGQGEANPN